MVELRPSKKFVPVRYRNSPSTRSRATSRSADLTNLTLQEAWRAAGDRSGEGVSARALERDDRVRPGWSSSDEARHRTGCRPDPGIEQRGDPGRCEARAVEAHLRCRDRHSAPKEKKAATKIIARSSMVSAAKPKPSRRLPRHRRRQPDPDAHGRAAEGGEEAAL